VLYLDSSAIAKLFIQEPEAVVLRERVADRALLVSSGLARVEVERIGRLNDLLDRAREVLDRVELLRLDPTLIAAAAELAGQRLRSLDAIHVASALSLGADLESLLTYDRRTQDAAQEVGLRVEAPGQGSR